MFRIKLLMKKCRIGKNILFENKHNISIGKIVSIGRESIISGYAGGNLIIKNSVTICSKCKIATCGGNIEIDEGTQIGDSAVITGQGGIYIGKNVLMADKVNIIANEHLYENINEPIMMQGEKSKPIYISEGTWIGINSTILGGVTIGKNCVVGANTVVTRDVPDYSVVCGAPARIIKKYDLELGEWINI